MVRADVYSARLASCLGMVGYYITPLFLISRFRACPRYGISHSLPHVRRIALCSGHVPVTAFRLVPGISYSSLLVDRFRLFRACPRHGIRTRRLFISSGHVPVMAFRFSRRCNNPSPNSPQTHALHFNICIYYIRFTLQYFDISAIACLIIFPESRSFQFVIFGISAFIRLAIFRTVSSGNSVSAPL